VNTDIALYQNKSRPFIHSTYFVLVVLHPQKPLDYCLNIIHKHHPIVPYPHELDYSMDPILANFRTLFPKPNRTNSITLDSLSSSNASTTPSLAAIYYTVPVHREKIPRTRKIYV